MPIYEVGKPFSPTRQVWLETAQYNFIANEHHLHLFMQRPSTTEVQAVKQAAPEFGLVVMPPVLLLLYRFSPIPWSDAPYSWHMVPADQRTLPMETIPESQGALLTTMLIDASTGIIRAIRGIGLGTAFSQALHDAIRMQSAAPFDQHLYDAALHNIYMHYQTSDALLTQAVARWKLGQDEPGRPRVQRGRGRNV